MCWHVGLGSVCPGGKLDGQGVGTVVWQLGDANENMACFFATMISAVSSCWGLGEFRGKHAQDVGINESGNGYGLMHDEHGVRL